MNFPKPFDRITVEPGKMGGKPCVRGLRISVVDVLRILCTYTDRADLFANYPSLEEEDLTQALQFAIANMSRNTVPFELPLEDAA